MTTYTTTIKVPQLKVGSKGTLYFGEHFYYPRAEFLGYDSQTGSYDFRYTEKHDPYIFHRLSVDETDHHFDEWLMLVDNPITSSYCFHEWEERPLFNSLFEACKLCGKDRKESSEDTPTMSGHYR